MKDYVKLRDNALKGASFVKASRAMLDEDVKLFLVEAVKRFDKSGKYHEDGLAALVIATDYKGVIGSRMRAVLNRMQGVAKFDCNKGSPRVTKRELRTAVIMSADEAVEEVSSWFEPVEMSDEEVAALANKKALAAIKRQQTSMRRGFMADFNALNVDALSTDELEALASALADSANAAAAVLDARREAVAVKAA